MILELQEASLERRKIFIYGRALRRSRRKYIYGEQTEAVFSYRV
jgi:hypothetical protein